jgi:hypothetical protein
VRQDARVPVPTAAIRLPAAVAATLTLLLNGACSPAAAPATPTTAAPTLPQLGQRLRLKADVDTARIPWQARLVAEAMKRYGVIIADHGSAWYVSGSPDDRWDNSALRALRTLHGSDFEAVDVAGLMLSRTSGATR